MEAEAIALAPLTRFPLSIADFDDSRAMTLARGIQLIGRPSLVAIEGIKYELGKQDFADVRQAQYWLRLEDVDNSGVSHGERANLFLLGAWLQRPTKTIVKFRFHLDEASGTPICSGFRRHLDLFEWNREEVETSFTANDLKQLPSLVDGLLDLRERNGRLAKAIHLTVAGCMSLHWSVAFVLHAAAAEAMLTWSERKLTRRLSRAFAVVVEKASQQRQTAYDRFSAHYKQRSDIIHGRSDRIEGPDRLKGLAELDRDLRRLWKTVLADTDLRDLLEKPDESRRDGLEQLGGGWQPKP